MRPIPNDDIRHAPFATTRWSLVLAARDRSSPGAGEALAALCSAYWYPLYAFARRKGLDPDSALDLIQDFFARILEKDDLRAVDPAHGRFRSFLMAACSHHMANRRDHDRAAKRGGGRPPIPIDRLGAEGRYGREPVDHLTAERVFERQWALALLELVLGRLEVEMAESGKSGRFEVFRPALLGRAGRAPYARIAADLGISEEAARGAAQRLRRRYRELIREEVARTVDDPAEVDAEILALFATLGG